MMDLSSTSTTCTSTDSGTSQGSRKHSIKYCVSFMKSTFKSHYCNIWWLEVQGVRWMVLWGQTLHQPSRKWLDRLGNKCWIWNWRPVERSNCPNSDNYKCSFSISSHSSRQQPYRQTQAVLSSSPYLIIDSLNLLNCSMLTQPMDCIHGWIFMWEMCTLKKMTLSTRIICIKLPLLRMLLSWCSLH